MEKLTPLNARNLDTGASRSRRARRYTLPDGKGSISFDGVKRYVGVDIHHNPGQLYALIFALLRGRPGDLPVRQPPPRLGAHRTHEDGRTMVEYGLLARGEDHRLAGEAAAIRTLLARNGAWDAATPLIRSRAPVSSQRRGGMTGRMPTRPGPSSRADHPAHLLRHQQARLSKEGR